MNEICNSVEYENAMQRLREILGHATLSSEQSLELLVLVKQIKDYENSIVEISDQIHDTRHSEGC